jgi:hypothetical protein
MPAHKSSSSLARLGTASLRPTTAKERAHLWHYDPIVVTPPSLPNLFTTHLISSPKFLPTRNTLSALAASNTPVPFPSNSTFKPEGRDESTEM